MSNGGSQNTFAYQPTLDALELKKDKGTDYVHSWKSKGVLNSKLKPLYSEYRIGIMYSGYVVTFDSGGSWSFDNNFARNVIIFGVDNSSSSHSDNRKNNFLILGESPTYGFKEALVHQKKSLILILVKQTQSFV